MPPCGEYLMAFESRLPITWRSLSAFPITGRGAFGRSRRELVLGALRAVEHRLFSEQQPHVDELLGALESPLLDAADIEKVVDQLREPAGLRVDDPEVMPPRLGVEISRQEEFCEPEHPRERRPQLMRDGVDEIRLQALALAQLRVLLLELQPGALEPLRHLVEAPGELADLPGAALLEA